MSDLSQIRNASRDVAEGLRRFERDLARFRRVTKAALEEGVTEREILTALNQSLSGQPDLQDQMRNFMQRLGEAA